MRALIIASVLFAAVAPARAQEEFKSDKYGGALSFKLPNDSYELKSYDKPCPGELWKWKDTIAEIRSKASCEEIFQGIVMYSPSAWTNEKYAKWRIEQWSQNNQNVKEESRKEIDSKYGKKLLLKVTLEYKDNPWFYIHLFIQKGKHNLEILLWCPGAVRDDSEKKMMQLIDTVTFVEPGASKTEEGQGADKVGGEKPKVASTVKVSEHLWKDFGVGTSVTYEMNTAGMKMEATTVLLWKDDKSYITRMDMNMSGTKIDGRPMEYIVEKPSGDAGGDPNAPKPTITEGDEEIEVPAGKFKCHWTQVEMEKPVKSLSKTWTNKDVPGGMVKMESEASGQKTSMVLLKLEKK